jgi:hypothetical protein
MQYLISVFYKQQPERPTIAQLLKPSTLQSDDRYTRVFEAEIEFSNASHETVLDELFATFNGHGKPLPANTTPIPRSMSVGDIIATGKEALGFIVTANGFEKLTFVPRGESFEITHDLLSA